MSVEAPYGGRSSAPPPPPPPHPPFLLRTFLTLDVPAGVAREDAVRPHRLSRHPRAGLETRREVQGAFTGAIAAAAGRREGRGWRGSGGESKAGEAIEVRMGERSKISQGADAQAPVRSPIHIKALSA